MISQPGIAYREEKSYIGIRTIVPFKGMFAQVDSLLKELRPWIKRHGITNQGPFFLRYHVIDMNGPMDIEVGFMITVPVSGDDRVRPGLLPSGDYANLTYSGSGLAGNRALIQWAKDKGVTLDRWDDPAGDRFGCRYEAYLTTDRLQPRKSKGVDLAIKIVNPQIGI